MNPASSRLAAAALLLAAALLPPRAHAQKDDGRKTDLGERGNLRIAREFDAYRVANPRGACRAFGSGRRVLITGFGLFEGAPYNISGTVVRSMAEPAFWPESVRTDAPTPVPAPRPVAADPTVHGAAAFNRSLEIDGERFEACFLVLDVIWDLAAAIIVYEQSQFAPVAVVMTGRGGGALSVEAAALNRASALSGFNAAGVALGADNVPHSSRILESDEPDYEVPMNWDVEALVADLEPRAEALGYRTVGQTHARPENDYLCNNVSYVALNAARRRPTALAGGLITLPPPGGPRPATGFLHFPAADLQHPALSRYGDGIHGWSRVLARVVRLAAQGPRPAH